MDALVDYSDSDGSLSEHEEENSTSITSNGGIVSNLLNSLPPPRTFQQSGGVKRKSDGTSAHVNKSTAEENIDDRKDWEKELAQQVAMEKPKTSGKRKIFAFGSLTQRHDSIIDEKMDEDDDEHVIVPTSVAGFGAHESSSELLKILPPPRIATAKPKTMMPIAPHLLREKLRRPADVNKAPSTTLPFTYSRPSAGASSNAQEKPYASGSISEDEDINEDTGNTSVDFFGIQSSHLAFPTSTDAPFVAPPPQAIIYDDIVAPGPSRPPPTDEHMPDVYSVQLKSKRLTDEQAQKLIYNAEMAPWGANDSEARKAVMNIKDVNVDEQLGSNVRETLLRNLNNKAMAQVAVGPLPTMKKTDGSKDKLAKQKHQITHLAQLAVSREEHLQEQWAEGRAKKRESASRYGFS